MGDGISLSVNLNKIALLRNSRDGNYPSVIEFGNRAINLGVNGLTVHPRPDQRHIRPQDVLELGDRCKQSNNIEFNIEGNPFAAPLKEYPGLIELVEKTRPDQCTLVPDTHNQKTSDHGFDLTQSADSLKPIIERLNKLGVRISLFMNPDIEQIRLAKELGVERIELYTGPYAEAFQKQRLQNTLFQTYHRAAEFALNIGLGVNAGHDLNLKNMQQFKDLPGLLEVSIGHALTVDALEMGFDRAIQAYLEICN